MHKTVQESYEYHMVQHDDGWVTVYITDYFTPVSKPKNYYGNPYTEKTLYYPEELEFEEPPYCTIQVRGTTDLLNIQPYALEKDCCKFWVWNVETNLNKRFTIPYFSVDAIIHGKIGTVC